MLKKLFGKQEEEVFIIGGPFDSQQIEEMQKFFEKLKTDKHILIVGTNDPEIQVKRLR